VSESEERVADLEEKQVKGFARFGKKAKGEWAPGYVPLPLPAYYAHETNESQVLSSLYK
jgi:hypothetical protein